MVTLDTERTRAANLDIQISALDSDSEGSLRVSALRARTLVQERLDSYKYPVLTLPNEIVSEIFVRVLPVYPERPPLTGTRSPKNLTHICRKWRDIALTTPVLWRALRLSLGDDKGIPFSRQVHELDTWLSRSGSCPFSLEVVSPFNPSDGSFIFSAARAERWERLQIDLRLPPSSIIGVPMPLLRHLELAIHVAEVGPPSVVMFREVPLLRSVVLDNRALMVILPWAQLTSLRLNSVYPHECAPVLQQTPNIVSCELHLYDHLPRTRTWAEILDMTLPRLESLTLVRHTRMYNVQTRYLATFIVPSLSKLHIEESILANPTDMLASFISKSGCDLREMYISGRRRLSRNAYSRAFPSVRLSFDEEYVGQGPDIANNTES